MANKELGVITALDKGFLKDWKRHQKAQPQARRYTEGYEIGKLVKLRSIDDDDGSDGRIVSTDMKYEGAYTPGGPGHRICREEWHWSVSGDFECIASEVMKVAER